MGKGTRRGGRRGGRARAHRSHARPNHRHHIHTRAHVGHHRHRHHFNTGFHHSIGGFFSNRHGRRRQISFNFGTTTSRRTTIATTGIAPILCIAGFVLTVAGVAMTASSWTDFGFLNDTPSSANDPLLIIGPVCLCLGGLLFISGVLICVFCKYCITSPVADTESGTNADSATANNQNDNELGHSSIFPTTLFTTDGEQQFGQSTTHLPPQYGQHQAYPPNTGQPTGEYTPQPPPTGPYAPQPGVPPAASGQYAPQTGFPPPTTGPSAPQPGAPQPGYAPYTSQPGAVPSAPPPTSYGMYAGQHGNDYNTQYNQPQPGQSPAAPPPSYESVTKGIHGSQEI